MAWSFGDPDDRGVELKTTDAVALAPYITRERMMEIRNENYRVWVENNEIFFDGTLRLAGPDAYAPIYSMALSLLHEVHDRVKFDLTNLELVNSSGTNLLAKLTIGARRQPEGQLIIKGTGQIPWQTESLPI